MLKTEHPAFNMNRHSSQKRTSKQDDVPKCWRKTKQTAWRRSDWFIWRCMLHCRCHCSSSGALCG